MALTILSPVHEDDSHPTNTYDASSSDDESGGMSVDSDEIDDRPRKRLRLGKHSVSKRSIVVPGEPITDQTQWMRYDDLHTAN